MPPKKKPKRKKSGVLQKQKQTQIVTVNVVAPAVRRRRRAKKSGSGTASGAPPPPPQGFAQVIYPVVNPLQRDTHFNLAGIQAQLKTLQDRAVGGVPLGAMPTQTQVQLGDDNPQTPSLGDETPLEDIFVDTEPAVASPELPREAPLVKDFSQQARMGRKKLVIVEEVGTDPMSDEDVSTRFKPISVPLSDPASALQAPALQAPASRRADGEPEDTPYSLLKFELPPPKKRGAPKLTPMLRSVSAPTRKQRSDKDEPRGPLLRTAEKDAFAHGASLMSILHQDRPREQPTPFRPANTYAESDRSTSQPALTDFFGLRQPSI